MEARKSKIVDKKALVGQLGTLVEGMRGELLKNKNARSLREIKIDTGGSKSIQVAADKNVAEPGKYTLSVEALAQKSSAITNGVEDKDKTYIGVGYITAVMPNGDEKEIYVDEKHANLSGIAKIINEHTADLGLHANVIDDGKGGDEPWKLIVSMDETGEHNNAEFPSLYFVDGEVDLYFEENRAAKNAKVKLDGFEVELQGNKTTDLIPGLTIDLKKAKPGEEIDIQVSEDIQKIGGKFSGVIDSINNVLKFIKEQNSLDEKSDTQRTLGGDLTLTTIESKIRSALFTPIMTDSGPMRMGDLGVTFQRSGLLQMDQSKFEAVLAKDYKSVAQVLTGKFEMGKGKTPGFIDNLENAAKDLLNSPSGVIASRKAGLQSNIGVIDRQIANRQRTIEKKEEILKAKFARLEETVSRIKGQGAGLAGMPQG